MQSKSKFRCRPIGKATLAAIPLIIVAIGYLAGIFIAKKNVVMIDIPPLEN